MQRYYASQWWIVPILPFFNFVVFFIRFAGIINSINTDSAWKTRTLSEEKGAFRQVIRGDVNRVKKVIVRARSFVNNEEE